MGSSKNIRGNAPVYMKWLLGALALVLVIGCCTPGTTGITAPRVISVLPASGSQGACPNAIVSAVFSEAMNPATINATTLKLAGPGTTAVTGVVAYIAATNTATFTPTALLSPAVTYTATITTGALDVYGNPLSQAVMWSFTTASNSCAPAPLVTSFVPLAGATGVCPNAVVTIGFSEAMNPNTINAADFTLAPGVIGTVTHNAANTSFTLTPSSSLSAGKTYTATLTTAAMDTFGNSLAANYVSSFTTAANACMPPPTVLSVTPAALATGVCPNKVITATFSEAMDPTTITAANFLLTGPGMNPVTGTVSYASATNQAIFAPNAVLALSTTYTATIGTGVKDLFGNNLAAPYTWTFTTGTNPCVPAPPPTSVTPANGATGICPNTVITATYAQAMNPATINAADFLVNAAGGAAVTGVVTASASGKVFTFTPTVPLALSTGYTVTITTAAQDVYGNAMAANYMWTFTTGASTCVAAGPPTIVNVTPAAGSLGVCLNTVVTATFSQAMNPATINTNTFLISPGVIGTVTLDSTGKVATFTPSALLMVSTLYTAEITTGAQSATGTPLAANYFWSFTTSSQACQPPVNLGSAANFGILAYSTVTNTGLTTITGENLGLSPGSSVTGFPPGVLVPPAVMDITNPIAAQAQLDATIAYNYMAGLPNAAALPNELSGLTFTPGLYKNATAVSLTSGAFTLNAQGNSNAVFIFQIGTTLTTLGNTQIILSGGAQAKNVFWQVGSAATLGTYSFFDGTIIAYSSITIQTGVTFVGRALALNGAVTLDTDTVTAP
jgi:hypothetical protein